MSRLSCLSTAAPCRPSKTGSDGSGSYNKCERLGQIALIVTPYGAGPNAAQRKAVNDALHGHSHAVAVMSDHRATRAIITAFSWFNSGLKSFRITDFGGAARHLGLSSDVSERLAVEVATLADGLALARTSAVG
ncbi:MAG: hypothetical protein AB8H86_18850 [Polyangiales bacterium]